LKIIQFIDSLSIGGSERMAVNISNVLAKDGHNVLLISSREKGPLLNFLESNVNFYFLGKKNSLDIFAFLKLIKLIIRFNPEVIHAHSSSVYWCLIIKQLLKFRFKLIFHDHYGLSENLQNKDRRFLRLLSKNLYGCIAVNNRLVTWAKNNLLINPNQILLINNFSFLKTSNIEKTIDNSAYLTILCLANFRPQKDHLTLIRAIDLLSQLNSGNPFKVLLAGEFFHDAYFHSIVKEIGSRNLESIIKILGPIDNVSDLLLSSDIGVLCSISEGLPVSLLEYGLAGLAVVVTDVGQCSEVVGHGEFGKIIEPNDSEALAETLLDLINQTDKRIHLGKKLKSEIEKNYGPQMFLDKYYPLLSY
jgi:glycosyltransferase involved in cell wall biosynthesis